MIHALWSEDQHLNLLFLDHSIKIIDAHQSIPEASQQPKASQSDCPGMAEPSAIVPSLLGKKENLATPERCWTIPGLDQKTFLPDP